MKFRIRVILLASVVCVLCLVFVLFSEPRFAWNNDIDDLTNDYVDVGDDDDDEARETATGKRTRTTFRTRTDDMLPPPSSAQFRNSVARDALIKRFLDWYDVRWDYQSRSGTSDDLWQIAERWVTMQQIHDEDIPELGMILTSMSSKSIISADVGHKGSQLKLTLVLDGGQRVVFKPQWYERDFIIEGQPYDGHDRHNAEIIAFHLNRLLGFRRVPLAVGRVIDLEKDIIPVATERLRKTFFQNGTNTCFYGKCLYCTGESTGVCAHGSRMEGAVILMLPKKFHFQRYHHPWGRTYKEGRKARWEYDENYCSDVKKNSLYSSGRLLMDIIDACVFDYILGNADRHHYEIFLNQSDSMLIMFDNGKSLGNPFQDEESILAPLQQCKRIRLETANRLRELDDGVLSRIVGDIVSHDPISPLVTVHHFHAMERRLKHVVQLIDKYVLSADKQTLIEYDEENEKKNLLEEDDVEDKVVDFV